MISFKETAPSSSFNSGYVPVIFKASKKLIALTFPLSKILTYIGLNLQIINYLIKKFLNLKLLDIYLISYLNKK